MSSQPPSINETLQHINKTLQSFAEGPYPKYSCKIVSWDDVNRGTVGGSLSYWGANITDTRLYAKDGRSLFTVREDNWNERLAKVTSNEIALVASNEDGGGGCSNTRPVTLRTVLSDPSHYGGYAGLKVDNLADNILDKEVSIRFQTTFLPVEAGDKSTMEFCPEAYNYNTMDDNNPRNLIFLCTTQGVAVQQDGRGAKKLYHHIKSGNELHRYWLEAESSSHKVGGSQVETKAEKDDALKRGKATSSVIGVKALGTRFNVLMTIQVPLKSKIAARHCVGTYGKAMQGTAADKSRAAKLANCCDTLSDALCCLCCCCCWCFLGGGAMSSAPVPKSDSYCCAAASAKTILKSAAIDRELDRGRACTKSALVMDRGLTSVGEHRDNVRISSAARVSRGSYVNTWDGLTVQKPERHPKEHITATIVMYYTCSGGIPTEDEVKAAIDDLEHLYQSLENGYLDETEFDFMKLNLANQDCVDIQTKKNSQPPPNPEKPKACTVSSKSNVTAPTDITSTHLTKPEEISI